MKSKSHSQLDFASILFDGNVEIFSKLNALVSLAADLNIFPIRLKNCYTEKSPLSALLLELCILYELRIKEIGYEKIMELINQKKLTGHFSIFEGDDKNKERSLSTYLIMLEAQRLYPSVDLYASMHFKNSRVHQQLEFIPLQKDELVEVDERFGLRNQGIFFNEDFLIYYHPFLRRYYTSNFVGLPKFLMKFALEPQFKLQIAIDPLRITATKYYQEIVEEDYWYGPKFSLEKLNSETFRGLAVYTRDPDAFENSVWPVERTEFLISDDKQGNKVIEIEEVSPLGPRNYSEHYHVHKYAHLIWSPQKNHFFHFDVSAKIYGHELHAKRLNSNWKLDHEEKCRKIKLFRIDGPLEPTLVTEVVSEFFRYNEMIVEFFSGK